MLCGGADDRVRQRGHDRLSVFGILHKAEKPLLRPLVRALQARGALVPTDHGGMALGGDARAILRGDVELLLARPPGRSRRSSGRSDTGANPAGDPLFDALRERRPPAHPPWRKWLR